MEQLKKAESHSLKRKIDNISAVPEGGEFEKPFIVKSATKTENLSSTQDRVTLSFNSFQKHLNALKTPQQAQSNTQNNSIIPETQDQIQEIESTKPTSGPIEGPFAIPTAKKLGPGMLPDLNNRQANQPLHFEGNNNVNNEPFYGTRYEFHQLNNTSFHTASVVKFPMETGGTAFQSRKTTKTKMLPKESEPKAAQSEESESIIIKTTSEKPVHVDDALLKRFMRMFEE